MKPQILIVCVNFNSYDALYGYLDSIYEALDSCDKFDIIVKIADNSTDVKDFEYNKDLSFEVCKFNNIGYLGAAQSIINGLSDIDKYKYVIISNVDLSIPKDFFQQLAEKVYDDNVAWIAPRILSMKENKNRNPKIIKRLSKKRISILQLFYKFPILNKIYEKFFYTRRQVSKQDFPSGNIYAGHGSFILLSNIFFTNYAKIQYPIFMFGEEIFLAELIRMKQLTVFYDSSLTIYDHDHISTAKMRKDFYYQCNYRAVSYLKRTFYE